MFEQGQPLIRLFIASKEIEADGRTGGSQSFAQSGRATKFASKRQVGPSAILSLSLSPPLSLPRSLSLSPSRYLSFAPPPLSLSPFICLMII